MGGLGTRLSLEGLLDSPDALLKRASLSYEWMTTLRARGGISNTSPAVLVIYYSYILKYDIYDRSITQNFRTEKILLHNSG